mgnify:FL=1
MSNLYKQYNTIEPEKNIRIMDYNAMVEQKLSELARKQNQTEDGASEDGFKALGAITEEAVRETPQELLEKAAEESKQMVDDAKAKAEQIVEDAQEKSQEILEEAKKNGYTDGYAQGESQAREELEQEYEQKNQKLEELKLQLQADYNKEMHELEPKLLDVVVTVVEKVFHVQFDDKKDILLYLVENTISNIEGCKEFRIRVGEEQKNFIENHKTEILDHIGHDMTLEIVGDSSMGENACVIETDTGIFDCSLGVQLENLIKDLRSLSL